MLASGTVLLDKFVIERELGRGAMGVVFLARHRTLDTLVAIKMLLPEYESRPETVARFVREARHAAKLDSDHIARVSDAGRLASGQTYMVMEFLRGKDLEALLQERGALPVAEAIGYLLQAIEGVAVAHAAGIIHRDLKPSNLFVIDRNGRPVVKVLDFGISKSGSGGSASAALTRTQGVLGSPAYMSPEQLNSSRDVDGRTDVWALGVVLQQLLTGRFPFNAETLPQLVAQVLHHPAEPLRTLRPDVSPALEAVVQRCLAKSREARYQNVTQLAEALAPFGPDGANAVSARIAATLDVQSNVVPAGLDQSRPEEFERRSMPAAESPRSSAGHAPGQGVGTLSSWGGTQSESRSDEVRGAARRTVPVVPIAAAVGCLLLAVGGIFGVRAALRDEPTALAAGGAGTTAPPTAKTPPTASASSAPEKPEAPEEPEEPVAEPVAEPIAEPIAGPAPSGFASAAPSPGYSEPLPLPSPFPSAAAPKKVEKPPTYAKTPSGQPPHAKPPVDCGTFYVDDEGIKHHRPECL